MVIFRHEEVEPQRLRGYSKKSVQQGCSQLYARSVRSVREHDTMATCLREPDLAAKAGTSPMALSTFPITALHSENKHVNIDIGSHVPLPLNLNRQKIPAPEALQPSAPQRRISIQYGRHIIKEE